MKDYTKIFEHFRGLPLLPRILLVSLAVLLIGVLVWSASAKPFSHSPSSASTNARSTSVALAISPLLFGTNLSLLNNQDQVLTSPSTQNQLAQMHIQIMRMPVRSNLPETTEIHAAQVIKSLNALPVVSLEGGLGSDSLAEDTRIVNDMHTIFGNSTVYYEYGDEENLYDVSAQSYTASWNAVIPSLKRLAPQGQFIGPVTYDYDQNYLATFLKSAHPVPNLMSWHEYTCIASDSPATCLANIKNWGGHIASARAVSNAALGKELPIMISEWNYAPEAAATTNQSNNANFVEDWTIQAFQTLAENHVFASMQYSCTGSTPLVDGLGNLTTQGKVFESMYQNAVAENQAAAATATATSTNPTTASATGTPTNPATATAVAVPGSPASATATATAGSPASNPSPIPGSSSTPTSVKPTPTPIPVKPTPTPTPIPAPPSCTQESWSSTLSPTSASGSSSRNVSGYCGGVIWLTLTTAPASNGHTVQMQVCYALRTTNCSSWVTYSGVNVWLKVASGLSKGQVFYINSRCTACTGSSFKIYGADRY